MKSVYRILSLLYISLLICSEPVKSAFAVLPVFGASESKQRL